MIEEPQLTVIDEDDEAEEENQQPEEKIQIEKALNLEEDERSKRRKEL